MKISLLMMACVALCLRNISRQLALKYTAQSAKAMNRQTNIHRDWQTDRRIGSHRSPPASYNRPEHTDRPRCVSDTPTQCRDVCGTVKEQTRRSIQTVNPYTTVAITVSTVNDENISSENMNLIALEIGVMWELIDIVHWPSVTGLLLHLVQRQKDCCCMCQMKQTSHYGFSK